MEGSGIQEDNKAAFSDRGKKQLKFMEQSIEHDGYGYKRNHLRKSNAQQMPNNYPVAKAQLQSMQRRLRMYPENIQQEMSYN